MTRTWRRASSRRPDPFRPNGRAQLSRRARSSRFWASGLTCYVDVHGTDATACPLLVVSDASPLAAMVAGGRGPIPTRVRGAQLRPLPVADRVRTAVDVWGWLDTVPGPAHADLLRRVIHFCPADVPRLADDCVLLRCVVEQVLLVDEGGVELAGFRAAQPDPLQRHEAEFVRHLLAAHVTELAELCRLLHPELMEVAVEIAPSGLDRHGLTLRIVTPDDVHEIRLPFAAPAEDPRALAAAMRQLLARARAGPYVP